MRPTTVIGIVLILLGIVGFAIKSITYTKDTTKLDVGPLEVTASEKRTVDIPDIAAESPWWPAWSSCSPAGRAKAGLNGRTTWPARRPPQPSGRR